MTKQKEDNRHESQSKAVKFLHGHKGVNLRPWPNNPENELTLVKAAKASCPKVKSRGKTTAKRKKRKERRKHSLEIVGNRRGLSITFDGQLRTRDGMGWDGTSKRAATIVRTRVSDASNHVTTWRITARLFMNI
mgnify:CR=1 FL=1